MKKKKIIPEKIKPNKVNEDDVIKFVITQKAFGQPKERIVKLLIEKFNITDPTAYKYIKQVENIIKNSYLAEDMKDLLAESVNKLNFIFQSCFRDPENVNLTVALETAKEINKLYGLYADKNIVIKQTTPETTQLTIQNIKNLLTEVSINDMPE